MTPQQAAVQYRTNACYGLFGGFISLAAAVVMSITMRREQAYDLLFGVILMSFLCGVFVGTAMMCIALARSIEKRLRP